MDEEDETWYFTNAKKVKINTGGKDLAKKVVIVHTECLKQIEMNRIQTTNAEQEQFTENGAGKEQLGKRKREEVIYEKYDENG